jgi:hypothetical protein
MRGCSLSPDQLLDPDVDSTDGLLEYPEQGICRMVFGQRYDCSSTRSSICFVTVGQIRTSSTTVYALNIDLSASRSEFLASKTTWIFVDSSGCSTLMLHPETSLS